jgi:four helix bundle protein
MPLKGYKKLDVWQKGIEIVELIYEISKKFPKEERYGLTAQMQKAAISIPSNIAEGYSRGYRKDFHRFCQMALGSCSELETQMIIADRLGYLTSINSARLEECLRYESRMLWKLIKSLRSQKQSI